MANVVCTPEPSAMGDLPASQTDELEYLSSATLTKRKDFLDREEEARGAPNRVLYFRRNADHVKLIAACTKTLDINPKSVRALLLRGSCFIKQGESFFARRRALLSAFWCNKLAKSAVWASIYKHHTYHLVL